jgi:hypothetical protein
MIEISSALIRTCVFYDHIPEGETFSATAATRNYDSGTGNYRGT